MIKISKISYGFSYKLKTSIEREHLAITQDVSN
jgi:hypothetical protein